MLMAVKGVLAVWSAGVSNRSLSKKSSFRQFSAGECAFSEGTNIMFLGGLNTINLPDVVYLKRLARFAFCKKLYNLLHLKVLNSKFNIDFFFFFFFEFCMRLVYRHIMAYLNSF
jgi:hypothetical protein